MEPVPYLDLKAQMRPIRAELDAAIARTLDNCSFCLGPDVAQFEKDFAKLIGTIKMIANGIDLQWNLRKARERGPDFATSIVARTYAEKIATRSAGQKVMAAMSLPSMASTRSPG